MIESIVFCLVAVSAIAALFFAWYFYQGARDKERIFLIEQGEKYEDILRAQKENRIKFIFPWLNLGIVTFSLSIAFLAIAFVIRWLDADKELFKGFLITFIIGVCLSISLFIIHFLSKKKKE
jgi:hypothetical protein